MLVDAHRAASVVLAAFGELGRQRARTLVVVAVAGDVDQPDAGHLLQRTVRGGAALHVVEDGGAGVDVHQQHEHQNPKTWTIDSVAGGHVCNQLG